MDGVYSLIEITTLRLESEVHTSESLDYPGLQTLRWGKKVKVQEIAEEIAEEIVSCLRS